MPRATPEEEFKRGHINIDLRLSQDSFLDFTVLMSGLAQDLRMGARLLQSTESSRWANLAMGPRILPDCRSCRTQARAPIRVMSLYLSARSDEMCYTSVFHNKLVVHENPKHESTMNRISRVCIMIKDVSTYYHYYAPVGNRLNPGRTCCL